MKKFGTKAMAFFLTLAVALTSIGIPSPQQVEASSTSSTSGVTDDGYEYTIYTDDSESYVAITGYSGDNTILDVPDTIEGVSVTQIANSAFKNCSSITEVVLPDSVTKIEAYAFEYCTSLTVITLSNNLKSIYNDAFLYCESLESITIPTSVTYFGSGIFSGSSVTDIYYDGLCSEWNAITMTRSVQYSFENYTLHFAECPLTMSESLIYLSSTYDSYDGNAKEPTATVICNGITLTQDMDYTITYADNVNAGIATVTVTGIGDYSGSESQDFTIHQGSPSLEASADTTSLIYGNTSQITASTKSSGTITYSSSDTDVVTVSSSGLVTAVGYGSAIITVTVAATDDGNYASASSTIRFIVRLKTPSITSIEQTREGVVLTWDAIDGAESYDIYRSSISSATQSKIARTTDTSYVDSMDRTVGSETYTYHIYCVGSNGASFASTSSGYASITVTVQNQTITASASNLSLIKGDTATITASTSGDGRLSYSSSDTSVATVSSSGKVTAVGYGTADITVTAAETATSLMATKTFTFSVELATPAISSITNQPSGIELAWGAVSGAEAYAVYRKTASESWSLVTTTTDTSYTDTAIRSNDGTTYYYRVCCVTSDGGTITSAYSSSKSLTRKITTYTVTFDGGGIETIASQTIAYGGKVTKPTNSMYRSEYTFLGWYYEGEQWDFDTEVTKDMKLTAKWQDAESIYTTTKGVAYAQWDYYYSGQLIRKGDTIILTASHCYTYCSSVSWKGYTTGFAMLQQNKPTAQFQAINTGTYTITATATSYQTGIIGGVVGKMYNTETSTFSFMVVNPVTKVSVSKSSISMEVGESTPLKYSTTPSGNWARTASGFYMKSSNNSVVTISDDAIIRAVGVGTATITIGTADGYKATCKVTVSEVTEAPSSTTISSVVNASTGIKVTWKKVSEADGYYIYRSTSKSGTYSKVGTVTSGSTVTYTDTGSVKSISSGTTYYYKVYAYTGSKKSSASSIKSIRYLTAGKISSLTNAAKGITVKWSKVSGASGYYIYRKISGGDYSKVKTISSASTVSWTDTAVKSKSGKTYTYYVMPYYKNSSGTVTKGAYTTKSLRRLSAVKISSLTNTSTGITVKWGKVSGASGYYVYRKAGSGSYKKIATVTSGSTVSYTNKTSGTYKVSNGTTYTYYVIPYYKSSSGTVTKGTYSAAKKTVRLTSVTLSSVKNSSSKKITVKWKKNSKASGYQIQYSTSSSFKSGNKTVTVSKAATVSRTIGSLTKKKTYYVRVRAYKEISGTKYYSAWSSKKSVKISK